MSQLPKDDDEKLVAFLRRYRPIPPSEAPNFEEQLMQLAEKQPLTLASLRKQRFGAVLGAIAAGFLLALAGYHWLNASEQVAANPEELEAFLIDSWNGITDESQPQALETEWLILAEQQSDDSTIQETGVRSQE